MSDIAQVVKAPHAAAAAEVARALGTDVVAGLSGTEAADRLARCGRNELAQTPPERWWIQDQAKLCLWSAAKDCSRRGW